MTPDCMTPAELTLWDLANRALSSRADVPCRDCPMAFALAMRAEGCCNGTPEPPPGRRILDTDDPRVARRRTQWRESSRRLRAKERTMVPLVPGLATTLGTGWGTTDLRPTQQA